MSQARELPNILHLRVKPNKKGHFDHLLNLKTSVLKAEQIETRFLDLSHLNLEIHNVEFARAIEENITSSTVVDFEWIHDFANVGDLDCLFNKLNIDWVSTGSISRYVYSNTSLVEEKLMLALPELERLKSLYVWDEFAKEKLGSRFQQLEVLPDVQFVDTKIKKSICCEFEFTQDFVIGHFGQLYPYRGIELLLEYSEKDEDFAMIFAGELKFNEMTKKTQTILKNRVRERRALIFPRWYDQEDLLNHLYEHIDGFFIDSEKYPQPSGFASKALMMGKPIIVQKHPSYYYEKYLRGNRMIVIGPGRDGKLSSLKSQVKEVPNVYGLAQLPPPDSFAASYLRGLLR